MLADTECSSMRAALVLRAPSTQLAPPPPRSAEAEPPSEWPKRWRFARGPDAIPAMVGAPRKHKATCALHGASEH
eukprot:13866032-Alexandrium_andersonii.AAC.1